MGEVARSFPSVSRGAQQRPAPRLRSAATACSSKPGGRPAAPSRLLAASLAVPFGSDRAQNPAGGRR